METVGNRLHHGRNKKWPTQAERGPKGRFPRQACGQSCANATASPLLPSRIIRSAPSILTTPRPIPLAERKSRKKRKNLSVAKKHCHPAIAPGHSRHSPARLQCWLVERMLKGRVNESDLGNVEAWRGDKRIRGGGYWGVASDQVRDIAAWVDFAEERGFKRVVLVGHSAGAAAVRIYAAEKQDPRVVGVVLASGGIYTGAAVDSDQVAQATRLMAQGEGEALVRDPKRSFPSYISAATLLDIANPPSAEFNDFFGIQTTTTNPPITRIHCPLLAFHGTRADVGGEKELQLLKSSIGRHSAGPSRVDTAVIVPNRR